MNRGTRKFLTLLTDFGARDAYVGAIRGVILSIAPEAVLVDLAHEIPPGNVRAGAFALLSAAPFFPRGSVHLAVVDPGVGGPRRPLALECDRGWLVGPDNGLLLPAAGRLGRRGAYALENRALQLARPGETFHGRDLFAPAAAHLLRGLDPRELGPRVEPAAPPPWPEPTPTRRGLLGEVIAVDRFGNLITNLPVAAAEGRGVAVRGRRLGGVRSTYAEVPRGGLLPVRGSTGFVEVAVREGSAARRLGAREGTRVALEPLRSS